MVVIRIPLGFLPAEREDAGCIVVRMKSFPVAERQKEDRPGAGKRRPDPIARLVSPGETCAAQKATAHTNATCNLSNAAQNHLQVSSNCHKQLRHKAQS